MARQNASEKDKQIEALALLLIAADRSARGQLFTEVDGQNSSVQNFSSARLESLINRNNGQLTLQMSGEWIRRAPKDEQVQALKAMISDNIVDASCASIERTFDCNDPAVLSDLIIKLAGVVAEGQKRDLDAVQSGFYSRVDLLRQQRNDKLQEMLVAPAQFNTTIARLVQDMGGEILQCLTDLQEGVEKHAETIRQSPAARIDKPTSVESLGSMMTGLLSRYD